GVDLASGRAVHAICRDRAVAVHPDTKQPLAALRVPAWGEVLLCAARSFEAIPLGYFGVDIVIDARVGPVILELNARPGLSIQLANRRGLRRSLEALRERPVAGLAAAQRVAAGVEIASL